MLDFSLDNLKNSELNRFVAVIIAAKQARKINQLFLSEREKEEKEGKKLIPAVEALKSLSKGEIEFQYREFKIRKPR